MKPETVSTVLEGVVIGIVVGCAVLGFFALLREMVIAW